MGNSDRRVYVVPSLGLVVTRMGTSAKVGDDGMPVARYFDNGFWKLLMAAAPH